MSGSSTHPPFPFVALVGQEPMRLALLLNVVHPRIGGLLLLGDRGTGKSTAVRALAQVMPPLQVVANCPFRCDPAAPCESCREGGQTLRSREVPVPVVDLPLGATDDRVTGALDLEAALLTGERRFEPGILARVNRGFLYIDEVNLLEDHLVDLLLDVAASGEHVVEREGLSLRHPSRFVLVGSGNPEEGELRPQLTDRFGLCARIETETDADRRVEITRRRLEFDDDPESFVARWEPETEQVRERLISARERLPDVTLEDSTLRTIAAINADLEIAGHRGELTLARAARAHAAWEQRDMVTTADLLAVTSLALRHRLRSDPLASDDPEYRIDTVVARHLPTS